MDVLQEKRSSPELRGYVKERVRRMRERMEAKGVDVSILLRPENVFYFSNFNPIIISHVPYFIITKDDAFLLVHSIRHDHAVNEGAADRVLCYGKWGATQAIAMDAMDAMRELLGRDSLIMQKKSNKAKKGYTEVDLIPLIRGWNLECQSDTMTLDAVLSAQNPGLNPELIHSAFCQEYPQFRPDMVIFHRREVLDKDGTPFR